MQTVHTHGSPPFDLVLIGLATLAIAAYLAGVVVSHQRGRTWPWHRSALWCAGVVCVLATVAGPLAAETHQSFAAHMTAHLLAGMIAPLLLVLAAPVTLALRTLAVTPARRVSRMLRSAPARLLSHPLTAGVLSAGGLWAIYYTPIFEAMRTDPLVHLVVHAHLVAAGFLFTNAVIGIDPKPHGSPRSLLAAVLVLTMASHAILAKALYASAPAGITQADGESGAQLMYYAGAWVEAIVIVIFCAQWYRAAGRRAVSVRLATERVP